MELKTHYGVSDVVGFRNGFAGLVAALGHEPIELTAERVSKINMQGGTILGTSRGAQDPEVMVDRLVELGIDILFVIGGDGSIRGAGKLAAVARAAWAADRGDRHPQDHRQRHPLHRAEFRLPDGVHRCGAIDRGGPGRGAVGDQRRRAGAS